MKWTQNEDEPVDKQTVQTTAIMNSNLTTTLNLTASRSINKASYSCLTYFIDRPPNFIGQTNATTKIVPKYKHKWTSSQLNVLCKYQVTRLFRVLALKSFFKWLVYSVRHTISVLSEI